MTILGQRFLGQRLATLAIGLAMAAVALPAFAQRSPTHHRSPSHMNAPPEDATREQAIRECAKLEEGYRQGTFGMHAVAIYRACMAEHGQAE
jgi:hypothetical protein